MEKKIKLILILAFILFQTAIVTSQHQTDFSAMKENKNYKIVLIDKKEVYGKFISTEQYVIKIMTEDNIEMSIPVNRIKYFTSNLSPDKYKISVSIMSGVSFLLGKYYPYQSTSGNNICPNLNVSGMLFFSDSKAVKVDGGITFFSADKNVNPAAVDRSVTGGNMKRYSFKASFVIGRFKPNERFIYYGSLGFGVHFAARDVITYKFYYLGSDSTQHVLTDETGPTIWINPMVSAELSLGYRFSKNFGVKTEFEYIMLAGSGYSFFTGDPNYFPLHAGLFYIF